MKKNYFLLLIVCAFGLNAQTTVNYLQKKANYTIVSDGADMFDDGTENIGMWANNNNKQVVAFRNFTETGLPGGIPSTMAIGDSFTIKLNATRAYGQIGIALLSSPTSTATWADRHNNYAVQVNMNGNGGTYPPIEVVSNGGAIDATSINGSTTYTDFNFKFTLLSSTTMQVSLNDGVETYSIQLNNQNITGYSIYLADDWNGTTNSNIYWKPTTAYVYSQTLGIKTNDLIKGLEISPNPVQTTFSVNKDVSKLSIYDVSGKLIKSFIGDYNKGKAFNIDNISKGLYLVQIENKLGATWTTKLIKL
ncbi:T9SS type A sorting domain-containing protein [Lacinutrix sp. Bg11-31]|uniref:T9SS type A sorting domain-containing protein n=1 Tax=Lacinutrix sp. Bg11-31 TaxID=2057808 RepID=UPI000C310900|nr:T9SS type A sorting domain-containing protein [Lacinutrix sp. Bg11-31]AUC83565.1 hypothetical protein CW733_16095 [Lacinutrix sp. Bg11-31]